MSNLDPATLAPLFGLSPSSSEIKKYLSTLASSSSATLEPVIKSYPDVTYHNHYSLGISLCFDPSKGLESVDIFNPSPFPVPPRPGRKPEPVYEAPPPIVITFPSDVLTLPPANTGEQPRELKRPQELQLRPDTPGRDLVACFGEPSRKGSGGWTGLWLEWSPVELARSDTGSSIRIGVMVELRDPGAKEQVSDEAKKKGMGGVWERAAAWSWASLKVFQV
ncbi:hypothetical protein IAU60_001126 [Kwoniella sp. DSM 27419]